MRLGIRVVGLEEILDGLVLIQRFLKLDLEKSQQIQKMKMFRPIMIVFHQILHTTVSTKLSRSEA